ncbi:MAG: hypothetical protein KKE05_06080, partial [Nanoarchaeota archaeon]|nr:hypothetical protein [Nanoarchaeota archaeon]
MKKEEQINLSDLTSNAQQRDKTKLTHRFITALSIVSIIGFLGIISDTLFGFDLSGYDEAGLMLVIGAGMVL